MTRQPEQTLELQSQAQGATYSRLVNGFPVYYGWIIMVVGTLGMIMTSPAQTYAVSIFIEHFIEDLDLSRSVVSTLYSGASLIAAFTLAYVGRQVDLYGSRVVMVIVAGVAGLACIFMGFVSGAILLGLGFLALRIFGHGALTIVSTNVVNQWWVRRRGTIMGISGLLLSMLGVGGFPNLINGLIPIYGWRVTYMILGLLLLLVLLPLALIFLRDRPEIYGLHPDGDVPREQAGGGPKTTAAEENWTVAEAMRTPTFWIVAVGLASIAMSATGLFFHMVSIFNDNGLSSTVAATVFVPIAATTAIVTLSSGILVDHLSPRILLTIALVGQAISLALAPFLSSVQLAFIYGVILGITFGLVRTVSSVIWAMYYGRLHLGSITGASSTIMVVGTALGPMPFGIGRDLLGSYNTILLISAILPLALGVAALFVTRPQKGSSE